MNVRMNDRATQSLLCACVLGACAATSTSAAPAAALSAASTNAAGALQQSTNVVETRINADHMEYDYAEQIVYLRGNVVVTDSRGILKSDNATVEFFDKDKDKDKENAGNTTGESIGDFKRVIANGNVHMISGTRVAVSDKAVWTYKENRIVLTGDDKQRPLVREVKDGKDMYMLTADRIVYDVKTQKFEFQPNPTIIMQPTAAEKDRFFDKSAGTKPAATGAVNDKK